MWIYEVEKDQSDCGNILIQVPANISDHHTVDYVQFS
jgi:hypothetical protein